MIFLARKCRKTTFRVQSVKALFTITLTQNSSSAKFASESCARTIDNSQQILNNLIKNEVEWIFGYGSLIWSPGFEVDDSLSGYISGYKRRFWLANESHRGNLEYPGRVLDLYESDEFDYFENFDGESGDSKVQGDLL